MGMAERLSEARELAGYSQEQVALALGVSRPMITYWEGGSRVPNDRQVVGLSRLYGMDVSALRGDAPLERAQPAADMMFRGAGDERLPAEGRRGLGEFVDFLDAYAKLAGQLDYDIHGMTQSPFTSSSSFGSADDARRKAEEVRAHLRLGLGPVGDVDRLCDLLGITVLRAQLGDDLRETISGAFFNHRRVGFSILVNLDMTPGRRRFTVAHELAHALFHSDKEPYVLSFATKDPRERFADTFAGEFLMPTEGVRRVMEEQGFGPKITDPADVIHLQRFYKVSYATALVRLRQSRSLRPADYDRFKQIRPVIYARSLGYEPEPEEFEQDADQWRLRRYPPRFLRLLRLAIKADQISVPSAAKLVGVSISEMADLAAAAPIGTDETPVSNRELQEFEQTGVPA